LKPFGEGGWYLNKEDNNMHPSVRNTISFNDCIRAQASLSNLRKITPSLARQSEKEK